MDKRGEAIPVRFFIGLEDDINKWARSQPYPVNFQLAVNLLIDRGLYSFSYHFPHFKQRFIMPA